MTRDGSRSCAARPAALWAFNTNSGSTHLDVKEGDDVTIRLAGKRTVTVRAVDDSRLPITQLRMRSSDSSDRDLHSADGTFVFDYLDPQQHTLRFSTPKCATELTREIDLTSGSVDLGTLVFSRGAVVRGVVVDRRGLALVGVRLAGSGADVMTDRRGAFEFFVAPKSRIELDVTRQGFVPKYVTFENARTDVRIVLTERGDAGFGREFGGVGMATSAVIRDGGLGYRILELFAGEPAIEAGLLEDDEVIALDGVPVVPGTHEAFMTRMRGDPDTVVQLTIRREGRTFDVRITRKLIRY